MEKRERRFGAFFWQIHKAEREVRATCLGFTKLRENTLFCGSLGQVWHTVECRETVQPVQLKWNPLGGKKKKGVGAHQTDRRQTHMLYQKLIVMGEIIWCGTSK